MNYYLEVVLLSPPYSILTYAVPKYFEDFKLFTLGSRVVVPLGNGVRVGVVVGHKDIGSFLEERKSIDTDSANDFVIKDAIWPLDKAPFFTSRHIEIFNQLATRQAISIGRILGSVLPAKFKTTKGKIKFFLDRSIDARTIASLKSLPMNILYDYARLWVDGKASLVFGEQNKNKSELCVLNIDPPWPVRPLAKAQITVLDYLHDNGPRSKSSLVDIFGKNITTTLKKLLEKEYIKLAPEASVLNQKMDVLVDKFIDINDSLNHINDNQDDESSFILSMEEKLAEGLNILPAFYSLTEAQKKVFEPLLEDLNSKKASSHLLFGVTGSGKTAIYLELARKCLESGRSVLILAPEIALVLKLWREAQNALPSTKKYLYHGYQNSTTKEQTFFELSNQSDPCIIIGSRSALFLPLPKLGLIVLDEEHDASFKQDDGFIYQAKDIAWYMASGDNALLLLGSATPDVKTYHAANHGFIKCHKLEERVSGGALPGVEFVHLLPQAEGLMLMPKSIEALNLALEQGEQVVILLNRRGYAPGMFCTSCQTIVKCPHCDIGLVYHKKRECLTCHYCGFITAFPVPCSTCGGLQYKAMGDGTEKLEEQLALTLPKNSVLRLDKDTTRRPGKMEEILSSFANKEASVLIGTQMLSKGHHFPDVTLVIVADADLGINLPDYRATEKTFQLLLQSAGRAGRGEKLGKVIIQTRNIDHYCWEYVKNADYEGFYSQEIVLREKHKYPPFVRLALVKISFLGRDSKKLAEIKELAYKLKELGKKNDVAVLGPVPAPLSFLQGRSRYQCLLKAKNWKDIRQVYSSILNKHKDIRISLDLDPVNML